MSSDHILKVSSTREDYVVSGLEDINAIVPLVCSLGRLNAHAGELCFNMLSKDSDELFCCGLVCGAGRKIIDLSANEDFFAVDHSRVKVSFVRRVLETHLVDQDVRDHTFP